MRFVSEVPMAATLRAMIPRNGDLSTSLAILHAHDRGRLRTTNDAKRLDGESGALELCG